MFEFLSERCGVVFTVVLVGLSVLIWGLGIAQLFASLRGIAMSPKVHWILGRLAASSTQVGLLGSVVGMINAFGAGSSSASWDESMTAALGLCFWTTAIGVFNALVAGGLILLAGLISDRAVVGATS